MTGTTQQMPMQKRRRIVLTGGPGGGKTTAADLLRRELGKRIVVVPESATILFAGGFPRTQHVDGNRAAQQAIFHVQRNLEDVQSALYPERVLLCDRGTVDGAAYWDDGEDSFFRSLGTTIDAELSRYDAVVFFETAAVAGLLHRGREPSSLRVPRASSRTRRAAPSIVVAPSTLHPGPALDLIPGEDGGRRRAARATRYDHDAG